MPPSFLRSDWRDTDAFTRSLRAQSPHRSRRPALDLILSLDWFYPRNGMGKERPMEDRKRFARGVPPRGCPEGRSELHAECLIEGARSRRRGHGAVRAGGRTTGPRRDGQPVDELIVTGTRYASREEASSTRCGSRRCPAAQRDRDRRRERAELVENGATAGALTWGWEPQHATVEAWVEEIGQGCVASRSASPTGSNGTAGEPAQPRCGRCTRPRSSCTAPTAPSPPSPTPRPTCAEQSAACRNEGLWPVPIGEAGDRRTMLASQVRLRDYPHVVPQPVRAPSAVARRRPEDDRRHPSRGLKVCERPRRAALR